MGEIVKFLGSEGYHLYRFSADILKTVRDNTQIIAGNDIGGGTFNLNLSSVFVGASFLEAYLNEDIAMYSHNTGDKIRPNKQFWRTLRDSQKDLSATQKWNLIAAACGGHQWETSGEPFQSYDMLVSLRNELVHFKGRVVSDNSPPIRKLKDLVARFKSEPDYKLKAMKVDPWILSLLGSRKFALWIDSAVFGLYASLAEQLAGYKRTPEEQEAQDMLNLFRYGVAPKNCASFASGETPSKKPRRKISLTNDSKPQNERDTRH